jgi:hypothetical protein
VSLWDEAGGRSTLRDVRGAGYMLGIERYNGARSCLSSARSESDVVIYGFPAEAFEECILKYPHAVEYDGAERPAVTAQRHRHRGRRGVEIVRARPQLRAAPRPARAASWLPSAGTTGAIAVTDTARRIRGLLTMDAMLAWVAAAGRWRAGREPPQTAPVTIAPAASIADASWP